MTKIITVRHAATDYSRQRKIAGTLDVPLSADGAAQAKTARMYLSHINYDVVVSSKMERALQTALLCTGLSVGEIDICNDCGERDFGKLQGLSPAEAAEFKNEIEYIKVGKYHHSLNPPDGETLNTLRLRAEKFRNYVLKQYAEKSVMIFSHHTFLQQFHGTLSGQDTFECLIQNIKFLEVNIFELDTADQLIEQSRNRPVIDNHESW